MRARFPDDTVPTLAALRAQYEWVRACCERIGCGHHQPLRLDPIIEKLGAGASSNRLRRGLRCRKCGAKGGAIQLPGWESLKVPHPPFPSSGEP